MFRLIYEKGGVLTSNEISMENKSVIDKWEENNNNVKYFVKEKNRALTPVYLIFKKNLIMKKFLNF